jgi:ADP-L-glycero-D-manno-heptose 6-epimerase
MIRDDKIIVITGALGFIGSGVVRYLNDTGIGNLLLVDNIDMTEKWKNILGKRFVDLISIEDLFSCLKGKEDKIGAFIHLGACSDTMETDGDFLMQNNYRFSVRLAEYALAHGHRFIYASSAATYGDGSQGFSDNEKDLHRLKPLNLYGFSKHLFDLWARQNKVLDRLVGLKYFNVFGPNEAHKGRMASMVYKMFPKVQNEGCVSLFKSNDPDRFSNGEQVRDFIYVKDAVKMTCSFLDNALSGIFNIGGGEAVTWNRLAKALFSACKKKDRIEYIPMPEELSKGYQNYTLADMSRFLALQKLDTLPLEYTIETAVEDYVHNYLLTGEIW